MKKTYGQQIVEHDNKKLDLEDDVIEYRKKMEVDIIYNILDTVDKSKNKPLYKDHDFYVVLLIKTEQGSTPRTFVLARRSCPSPLYKQSVWKYHHQSGDLEFLWTIPDRFLYMHVLKDLQKYLSDKETSDLAKFVMLMESGELLEWVKRENGEKKDAIISINKEQPCPMN